MRLKLIIVVIFLLNFFDSGYSWNNAGHQIIAAIAYDHLNPAVKEKIDRLTAVMYGNFFPKGRFLLASAWPDIIRTRDVHTFDTWHFINYPYIQNAYSQRFHIAPIDKENVLWAIDENEKILKNSQASLAEKSRALSFLIHFVGDVHQPLHCATLYNQEFPNGDRGGNDYRIVSPLANNLHEFWYRGAGYLYPRIRFRHIEKMAHHLEQQFPKDKILLTADDNDQKKWALESFNLAKNAVYQIPLNSEPNTNYTQQTQHLVKKQLALSGYRLADLLNSIEWCIK